MDNEKTVNKTKRAGLTKQERARVKEIAKEKAMKELGIDKAELKTIEDMMKMAKMPIHLKDKDIELGEGEVDIRGLSQANINQMFFRLFCLNNVTLNSIDQSLTDVLRLMLVLLKRLGVEDITKAIDDLEQDLKKVINKDVKTVA